MEFKLWHDADGNTFHNQTNVYFSQCARTQQLSLHELLRLTSDAAVEDYRQRGMSREFLAQQGFAILVSRVAFRFDRMPRENERITLTTWEEKPEPLQLMRAYTLSAQDGTAIVRGLSSWLVVDPVARRILPTKKFTLRTPVDVQAQTECPRPAKIALPGQLQTLDERTIRYSDLDGNGHTNNARYGAFIMDSLPAEWRERQMAEFRINYSKEAMLGDRLTIQAALEADGSRAVVVGRTDAGVSFESEILYA